MLIKDIIYRFVNIPNICKQFIDTPEFNRLRRLKQLGLAYHVFPSVNHTRFEHSLGVCFLAGRVADVLRKQGVEITEREKELLQLAGLLHDVGHVGLCHLFDYILEEIREKENKKEEIKREPRTSLYYRDVDSKSPKVREQLLVHHEDRSVYLLRKINSRLNLLTENEMITIENMIKGQLPIAAEREVSSDSENKSLGFSKSKPFLFEIVCNNEFGLDVDRLDYAQRDLTYCGMPCFQPDYIIECMRVNSEGKLCILEKARPELEMMYEARKRLLLLVCRHKTVVKIENIYREAIKRLGITGEWFRKNWESLDDYRLHTMIEDNCGDLLSLLYERDWTDFSSIELRLNHIKLVKREDIDKEMSKVVWWENEESSSDEVGN